MLFSSIIFIFIFLPVVLLIYYVCLRSKRYLQNVFLLIVSLIFYAWGEPKFVFIMMGSIVVNWCAGYFVDIFRENYIICRLILIFDIMLNILALFIFKYLMFTINNINIIFSTDIQIKTIALPIGISFFTFQAISYVVDIYRKKGKPQKNIINVGLYISFFPQLIAGPIVRYETVADQILNRQESFDDFAIGVRRFIIGLAKKVIIANNMAIIADNIYSCLGDNNNISILAAWLGAIAYTFQIYFDFSGYSDMAIGLGRMFGFHFLENFNYPYISKSCTEFWRRWHISMGTWFRDYIYFPLGGSRVNSKYRHIFNLLVVWFCTGLWHGANWTFVLWGLLYFVLLVFEKNIGFDKYINKGTYRKILMHIYTLFFVVCGWVLFRSDTVGQALVMFKKMFGIGDVCLIDNIFLLYFRQYFIFIIIAIIACIPILKLPVLGGDKKQNIRKALVITEVFYSILLIALLIISVSYIVKGSYNPFIYFNF